MCSSGPCPEKVIFGLDPKTKPPVTKTDLLHGEQVDLMEISDAWGKPMRYQVNRFGSTQSPVWRWELRSAGPDGIFSKDLTSAPTNYSGMFLTEDKSGDDVILSPQ